jgi:xanthine dehydrogenase YagS FAD-binding subunit
MKPFEYIRAGSVAEAIQIRSADPTSKFLAGGSNLVDLMKYDVESPARLVDITHLPLAKIEATEDGGLMIGAMVRNSDCAANDRVKRDYKILSDAILAGASPQLRNMATTGGNLLQRTRCYYFYDTAFPCNKRQPGSGCPAIEGFNRIHAIFGQGDQCIAVYPSDMAVALALLDATIHVEGPDGKREISMDNFHVLPGNTPQIENTLKPGELILGVELPKPARLKTVYIKVRDRSSYAFALVSVAAGIRQSGGKIEEMRLALGGVSAKPVRLFGTEREFKGEPANDDTFRSIAEAALAGARGYEHNAFKVELAKRTIIKALREVTA